MNPIVIMPACHRKIFRRRIARGLMLTLVYAISMTWLAAEEPTDAEIKSMVETYILVDSSVPSNELDLTTAKGVVTLSGTAPNFLAKDRAAAIAESVKGVRSVVDNIEAKPTQRTDEEIHKDVEAAYKGGARGVINQLKVE